MIQWIMQELDYLDSDNNWHIMCACGHTVSGDVKPGDKIAVCPNCRFLLNLGQKIVIVYPDRFQLPIGGRGMKIK